MLALLRERLNGRVGEGFPAFALMTARHSGLDGECSVEQEDALVGPMGEIALPSVKRAAGVFELQFLVDIDQRRRWLNALLHRKTQTVGLARAVVGILSEDDHFHLVERRAIECLEDKTPGRIANGIPVGLAYEAGQNLEVGHRELGRECLFPGWLDLDFH